MYFRGKSEVKGQYVSFPPPPKRIKKAELLWSEEPGVPYLLCFPMPLSSPPYAPTTHTYKHRAQKSGHVSSKELLVLDQQGAQVALNWEI